MTYRLADKYRWLYEMRARWSALSDDARPGHFRLFNKNANETLHVRVVGQVPNEMVWLVECADVPSYFRTTLELVQ